MSQREFHPGDVVSHCTWGIGLIVEIYPGASPEVKIDFQNKPQHRMSLQLARSSLTIRSQLLLDRSPGCKQV